MSHVFWGVLVMLCIWVPAVSAGTTCRGATMSNVPEPVPFGTPIATEAIDCGSHSCGDDGTGGLCMPDLDCAVGVECDHGICIGCGSRNCGTDTLGDPCGPLAGGCAGSCSVLCTTLYPALPQCTYDTSVIPWKITNVESACCDEYRRYDEVLPPPPPPGPPPPGPPPPPPPRTWVWVSTTQACGCVDGYCETP